MTPPKFFYFVVKTTLDGFELIDRSDRDVVEVVRCGECEHRCVQKNGHKFCGLHGSHYGMPVTNDFFCRDGERKDG